MSTKRKLQRRATFKVHADKLVYDGEDGEELHLREGEWAVMRKALPMNLIRAGSELKTAVEGEVDIERLHHASQQVIDTIAPMILDWNFHDLEAEPDDSGNLPILPVPRHEPDVLWRLDMTDVFWFLGCLENLGQPAKNSDTPLT